MEFIWLEKAINDAQWFYRNDQKSYKKLYKLIEDIKQRPFTGLGKPEPLKHEWSGWWSRRITQEHRLIYKVKGNEVKIATIASCKGHY